MISLYNIDWIESTAEIGRILIGAMQARGKGFARDALAIVIRAARHSQLKKLMLEVKHNNVKAIGLYKSIGFRKIEESLDLQLMTYDL